MIERIMIVVGVSLLLVTIMAALNRHQLSCAQSSAKLSKSQSKPQLLYFWSNQCSQCTSVQTPIIEDLAMMIGEDKLTVHKTNISDSLEQATRWGVKTVPSTYVLDKNGIVRHVNNGLRTRKQLIMQIEGL